jgi:hypothetical protein
VQDAAILLVDKFARVGWVDVFEYFIAYLPTILDNEQFRQKGFGCAPAIKALFNRCGNRKGVEGD